MDKIAPILVQGAMDIEIEVLKNSIEDIEEIIIDGYKFYKGNIEGHSIVISKTEIGIMNCGIATLLGIKNFLPCIIINQGTLGGFGNIHKGDIVIGQECFNLNSYKTPYLKKGEGSNPFNWELQTFREGIDQFEKIEADTNIIKFIKTHEKEIWNGSVVYGTIGSGDCWNQEIDYITYLNEKYETLGEDMETIGAYKIAHRYEVPIVGIRVVSDNEILQEEYDRTIAYKAQEFTISLCKQWILKEGNK